MKALKKILALVLCLMMVVPAALAAEGDAIVARRNEDNPDEGFQDYISASAVMDDTLYLLGGNSLYTYKVGDADVTKAASIDNTDQMLNQMLEGLRSDDENVTTNLDTNYGFFARDGKLYMLNSISDYWTEGTGDDATYNNQVRDEAVLFEITIDGDKISFQQAGTYDWTDMIMEDGDYVYSRSCNGSIYLDGKLFIRAQDDNWNDAVYCLDLDSGSIEQIDDLASAQSLTPYTDGKLLAVLFTYDKPTEAKIVTYDPASGSVDELQTLTVPEYTYPQGLVADTDDGAIFLVKQGAIWQMNSATGEQTEICDMPIEGNYNAIPMLLEHKYYVTYSYEGVAIRNVRPSADEKASYTLRVTDQTYNNSVTNAYYSFANTHGEAMVVLSRDNVTDSQIIEDMMNRAANWDVYVISANSQAYDAVFNRGYMAELSGSEKLNNVVSTFYPSIQEQLKHNGSLVALPVQAYGNASLGLNLKAAEKLGMTQDEIPTNWDDLLTFLTDVLPDKLPDDGTVSLFDSSTDVESCRYQLLSMILDDYQKYLEYSGIEQGYNTEILNNLLTKLDQVDFVKLGQPEQIDWDNYEWKWDEAGYLFSYGAGCTPDNFDMSMDSTPIAMSMTADTPFILDLDTSVAFVNPFSEHVDEAIEFLETLSDNLSNSLIYALDPSKTEPIRSTYYEQAKKDAEEYLENLKQQIEDADEADKQMLQEQLDQQQQYYDNIDNYYWEITPAGVEWYHNHDDLIRMSGYNMMYGASDDTSEEIWNLRSQYVERQITAVDFLKGIDKKLQMMILENQ